MASTSAFVFPPLWPGRLELASERRRARVNAVYFWCSLDSGAQEDQRRSPRAFILMRRLLTSRFDSDRKECVDKESSKGTAKRHDDVVMPRKTLSRYIG